MSNKFVLRSLTEVAQLSALSPSTNIRPFAEVQSGVEDLIRIGVDVGLFGDLSEALLARADVSGQRYSVIDRAEEGFLLSAGVDLKRVIGSLILSGNALRASKYRARKGWLEICEGPLEPISLVGPILALNLNSNIPADCWDLFSLRRNFSLPACLSLSVVSKPVKAPAPARWPNRPHLVAAQLLCPGVK